MKSIKKIILLGLFIGLNFCVLAQNNSKPETKKPIIDKSKPAEKSVNVPLVKIDTSRNDVTQQIEVVRAYKPILAEAVKIRISPDLNNQTFSSKLNYNLLDKRLEQNSEIRKLDIQKVIPIASENLKNNFVKFGVGNLGTTIGQLNLATGVDEALQAGFNFNHIGQKGKLSFQQVSQQSASAYGKNIGDNFVLGGKLNYNRQALNYYGRTDSNVLINTNPTKQVYSVYGGEAEINNRLDVDETNNFAFSAKANAYYLKNSFELAETGFVLSSGISKNLSKFQIGLNGLVDFTSTVDSILTIKNHFFKLNPFLKIDGNRFKLTAGINYSNEFGTNQRIYIFPKANFDYELIKDYLTLFGSVSGDVNKTRVNDIILINPFLNNNLQIKNVVEKLAIAGGVNGTIVPNVGIKAMVKSSTITDFQYFINNPTTPEKFDLAYDSGNSQILSFLGEVNAKFSDRLLLAGNLEFNQYSLNEEQFAWFNPTLKISSSALIKIVPSLQLSLNAYYQSLSKAKMISPDFNNVNIATLESFIDFGVGLKYHYNKKIAAFVNSNNLLGTEYQRFRYYPNFGLNIYGGFTYSF